MSNKTSFPNLMYSVLGALSDIELGLMLDKVSKRDYRDLKKFINKYKNKIDEIVKIIEKKMNEEKENKENE